MYSKGTYVLDMYPGQNIQYGTMCLTTTADGPSNLYIRTSYQRYVLAVSTGSYSVHKLGTEGTVFTSELGCLLSEFVCTPDYYVRTYVHFTQSLAHVHHVNQY